MSDTYDAGNQQHVDQRKKGAKVRDRQLDEAFRWMMADEKGRTLMWDRLARAGVFRASFATPDLMAFNEGKRSMGLNELDRIMRLCPAEFTRMQAEAIARLTTPKTDGETDGGSALSTEA